MKKISICFFATIMITISCQKKEFKQHNSEQKYALIEKISYSQEFDQFVSNCEQEAMLIKSVKDIDELDFVSNGNEIEDKLIKLYEQKKIFFNKIVNSFGRESLKMISVDDFKTVVNRYYDNKNSNVMSSMSKALTCGDIRNKEQNACFHNFVVDETACFFEGLWGIVSGCHIQSVKDQYNCNRAAELHFKDCMK